MLECSAHPPYSAKLCGQHDDAASGASVDQEKPPERRDDPEDTDNEPNHSYELVTENTFLNIVQVRKDYPPRSRSAPSSCRTTRSRKGELDDHIDNWITTLKSKGSPSNGHLLQSPPSDVSVDLELSPTSLPATPLSKTALRNRRRRLANKKGPRQGDCKRFDLPDEVEPLEETDRCAPRTVVPPEEVDTSVPGAVGPAEEADGREAPAANDHGVVASTSLSKDRRVDSCLKARRLEIKQEFLESARWRAQAAGPAKDVKLISKVPADHMQPVGTISLEELGKFDSKRKRKLVSVYGDIFDVSALRKFCPGGNMSWCCGKDITHPLLLGLEHPHVGSTCNELYDVFKSDSGPDHMLSILCTWRVQFEDQCGAPVGRLLEFEKEETLPAPHKSLLAGECAVM